jgi:protein involved in polysaccharide export with SLBB domain
MMTTARFFRHISLAVLLTLALFPVAYAQENGEDAAPEAQIVSVSVPGSVPSEAQQYPVTGFSAQDTDPALAVMPSLQSTTTNLDAARIAAGQIVPFNYSLGPDDSIEITVLRHPEFSGVFLVNQDGIVQYKFVGDIQVMGMTKAQVELKLKELLSKYIVNPEINVTVLAYRSKVFYVLGEVRVPGKYYMRAESIPIREALFEAGLPTPSAAMRKCRIVTPRADGKIVKRKVNVYALLYGGDLRRNVVLRPGDVLYVPATVMAKILRIINPVASTVGVAASGPESAVSGKSAVQTLQGRPI